MSASHTERLSTPNPIVLSMAMMDIVYIHSGEPNGDGIRRASVAEMDTYMKGLVKELRLSDISCSYASKDGAGKNTVVINGKNVEEILRDLDIKLLDSEQPDKDPSGVIIQFNRGPEDWNTNYIEDISDTLMKNAVSKAFADIAEDRIDC